MKYNFKFKGLTATVHQVMEKYTWIKCQLYDDEIMTIKIPTTHIPINSRYIGAVVLIYSKNNTLLIYQKESEENLKKI